MASAIEMQALNEEKKIVGELLESKCSSGLVVPLARKVIDNVLIQVQKPDSFEQSVVLAETCPTYRQRLRLTQALLENTNERGIRDERTFGNVLEKHFREKQASCEDQDLLGIYQRQLESNDQNWPNGGVVYGIVTRKSPNYMSLLFVNNAEDESLSQGLKKIDITEFVIKRDLNSPGFGISLKIGDLWSVQKSSGRNPRETEWKTQLHCCISLTDEETKHFFRQINQLYHSDGASEALMAILSCIPVWNHIVDKCCGENTQVTEQVIAICTNIASVCKESSSSLEKLIGPCVETNFLTNSLKHYICHICLTSENSSKISTMKRFLYLVAKTLPKCVLGLMPLVEQLSSSIISGTESEHCKSEGLSVVDFLIKFCTSVATKVPGAFDVKDPHSLSWKLMPLNPTSNEIKNFSYTKTEHLPRVREGKNPEERKYDSVDQYLNTYFTLLREECFFKLKKGILGFQRGKFDPKDMALYRISLEDIDIVSNRFVGGLSLVLYFEFSEQTNDTEQQRIDWESCQWLRYGNLLCISLDNTFQQPIWACVSRTDNRNSSFVSVTMISDRNVQPHLDFAGLICKLQELKNKGEKAFMAESYTFYPAFSHSMAVLQELQERDKIPFQDSLVFAQTPDPAPYITKTRFHPDWSPIFSANTDCSPPVQVSSEEEAPYDLIRDFEDRKLQCQDECPILDETQLAAVELALKHSLALIQGPPGTGKTHVGLRLVKFLLSLKKKQEQKLGPILVKSKANQNYD